MFCQEPLSCLKGLILTVGILYMTKYTTSCHQKLELLQYNASLEITDTARGTS